MLGYLLGSGSGKLESAARRCANPARAGWDSSPETPLWVPGRMRPGTQRRSDEPASSHRAVTVKEPGLVPQVLQAPLPVVGR